MSTTFDAVMPGAVPEGKRSIWQLGQIEVYDGGSDGLAATAGNTLFARRACSSRKARTRRLRGSASAGRCPGTRAFLACSIPSEATRNLPRSSTDASE